MVPFPGKLWEQRRMAVAEANAVHAQLAAIERDVIREVSEAYDDLYAIDKTVEVIEELHETLKTFEGIAQARYASEGGSQGEVAKAQAEVSGALQRLLVLRQQRQTAAALLNALLDRDPHAPVGQPVKPDIPRLSSTLEELLELAKRHRPEIHEATAMVTRDQHANTLAKFAYVPDVSVGFQYIQIGGGQTSDPDDGKDAWMVPLKVTIPLWQNRLIPALREAKRNLRASRAQLEQTQNLTEYEVKDAYYRFTTATQVVELHEAALIPEAELAFSSERASYEAGGSSALHFIDSVRVYLNTKVSYYEAVAGALKSFAALERMVGTDLERQGGNP
jgi:outer membrane protein TolC